MIGESYHERLACWIVIWMRNRSIDTAAIRDRRGLI